MPTARIDDIDIHYLIEGEGDPVMLITGLGGAGRSWGDQIGRFADGYLTVVPDHRGAGASSHPEDGYTIARLAADMAGLLRSLGTGPAHLVGSSTGGAIAQVMALDHADVVRSISLVSSWARPDDWFRHQFAVRKATLERGGIAAYAELSALFLYSPAHVRNRYPAVRAWVDNVVDGTRDPAVLAKRIDMILDFDEAARLPQIDVPALVVVGSGDVCTPPYCSEELASLIPGARLEVLDGGHLVAAERPDQFHHVVRAFIEAS